MEINRVWEMPNSRTFQIKAIKEIIEKYSHGVVIDPFAKWIKWLQQPAEPPKEE